jgi:murein DD-endopeptidase MepM/ murein hydrolase activator NlpD
VGRVAAVITAVLAGLVLVVAITTGAITAALSGSPGSCAVSTGPSGVPPGLSAEQAGNAALIVAIGKGMGVPAQGWVVAVATALQETDLINERTATDHDSLGLFQQRPSQGWGTPAQITDPAYATRAFYHHLLAVPGWQAMPVTEAAQAVQRSAYPDAYARQEARARAIVAALTGVPAACSGGALGVWVRSTTGPVTSGFHTTDRPDHDGIDLGPPRGTPVVAASAGVVTTAMCDPATGNCDRDGSLAVAGCGWYVEIHHAGNVTTRYCHLAHQPVVRVGQTVSAGTALGVVGQSGNADGPHLHFEVHTGYPATHGNAINPAAFLRSQGVPI